MQIDRDPAAAPARPEEGFLAAVPIDALYDHTGPVAKGRLFEGDRGDGV